MGRVRLVYAAETVQELAYVSLMDQLGARFGDFFEYYVVLNNPPLGWTQGVGFVDADIIRTKLHYPPTGDIFNMICGPPIFEKIMLSTLQKMGYEQTFAYSQSPE